MDIDFIREFADVFAPEEAVRLGLRKGVVTASQSRSKALVSIGGATAVPVAFPSGAPGSGAVCFVLQQGPLLVGVPTGDTAWTPVAFQNTASQGADTTHGPCAYRKDAAGVVRFRGIISVPQAAVTAAAAFTLPPGYRPANTHAAAAIGDGAITALQVLSDGRVAPTVARTNLSLAPLSFLAEA